jgi:hypothetical protein
MEPIKGAVESLLANLKSRCVRGAGAKEIVCAAFSKKEQAHMRVISCQRGKLRIAVDSSTWLYYFNLKKKALTEQIAAGLPEVKELVFVIGETGAERKKRLLCA